MLRTPVCDVFGIEVPVVMGPLGGPWPQAMELPAAVCRAGGLGSVATTLRTPEQTRADIARLRELLDGTDRPFAVNMTRRPYDPEVFEAIMADPPPVFSMALGEPGDLVKRVHDAGAVFLQQVTNVAQAERAGEAGADVISAQGHESGGFSGLVSALALVPQVVRAIAPIPVIASGGIADGRGLAAALMLGAHRLRGRVERQAGPGGEGRGPVAGGGGRGDAQRHRAPAATAHRPDLWPDRLDRARRRRGTPDRRRSRTGPPRRGRAGPLTRPDGVLAEKKIQTAAERS